MANKIEIRLCLYTELGYPAGPRLARGAQLPVTHFDFPATKEGWEDAKTARGRLQEYCDAHFEERKAPGRRK